MRGWERKATDKGYDDRQSNASEDEDKASKKAS